MVLHKMTRYDFHFLLGDLIGQKSQKMSFSVTPKTKEEIFKFSYDLIRFSDSLRFVNKPLAQLAKKLKDCDFAITKEFLLILWIM